MSDLAQREVLEPVAFEPYFKLVGGHVDGHVKVAGRGLGGGGNGMGRGLGGGGNGMGRGEEMTSWSDFIMLRDDARLLS